MTESLVFAPLVDLRLIWGLMALAMALLGFALWKGLRGWPFRALAFAVLALGLANPSLQIEDRKPLNDIVLLLVDESASQGLAARPAQSAEAVARISAQVAALGNTDLRVIRFGDGPDNAGTLAMTALAQAIAEEPRARISGAILVTDGQVHDLGLTPALPAPLHVLLTGTTADWDRRLIITEAPAFAIMGEDVTLKLRVQDEGAVPAALGRQVVLKISLDDQAPLEFTIATNTDLELPLRLPHAGMNVLQFSVAAQARLKGSSSRRRVPSTDSSSAMRPAPVMAFSAIIDTGADSALFAIN